MLSKWIFFLDTLLVLALLVALSLWWSLPQLIPPSPQEIEHFQEQSLLQNQKENPSLWKNFGHSKTKVQKISFRREYQTQSFSISHLHLKPSNSAFFSGEPHPKNTYTWSIPQSEFSLRLQPLNDALPYFSKTKEKVAFQIPLSLVDH